jgi:hypothetical protein
MTKTQQAELKEFLEKHKTTEASSFNQQIARSASRMAAFEDCNYHSVASAIESSIENAFTTGVVYEEEKREAECYDAEVAEQYFIGIADKFPPFTSLEEVRHAELFVMAAMDRLNPDYLEKLDVSEVIKEESEELIVDVLSHGTGRTRLILNVCGKTGHSLTSADLEACQSRAERRYEEANDDPLKDATDYFKDALTELGFRCEWKAARVVSLYNRKKK